MRAACGVCTQSRKTRQASRADDTRRVGCSHHAKKEVENTGAYALPLNLARAPPVLRPVCPEGTPPSPHMISYEAFGASLGFDGPASCLDCGGRATLGAAVVRGRRSDGVCAGAVFGAIDAIGPGMGTSTRPDHRRARRPYTTVTTAHNDVIIFLNPAQQQTRSSTTRLLFWAASRRARIAKS